MLRLWGLLREVRLFSNLWLVFFFCLHPADPYTRSPVTNTKGQPSDKIDIGIGDESGEAILTLYGRMMLSALRWTPVSTILLISRVNWRLDWRLSVTARTMIEVDPDIVEAEWLRRVAVGQSRCVNQVYPEGGIISDPIGAIDRWRLGLTCDGMMSVRCRDARDRACQAQVYVGGY